MRDLLNNSTQKELIPATASAYDLELAASLTVNGTSVDLIGEGRKCLLVLSVGSTSTATVSIKVTSGTDDSSFGTTEVSDQILETTGITIVDFEPSNRYIRAEYTVSETGTLVTHTNVSFAAVLVVYNERVRLSNVT